jgi:uncharacterized membrane protein YhaH (DUF805 family)
MDWYLMVWRKYAEFAGRSRRKEYWMFTLFNALALLVLVAIGGAGIAMSEEKGGALFFPYLIYALAVFVPALAVTVRRLHDIGKSGWLLLLFLVLSIIPIVGLISTVIMIVFLCQDGDPNVNQYGPNPKFPEQAFGAIAGGAQFTTLGLFTEPPPLMGVFTESPCRNCGAKIDGGSSFCTKCGAHV